MTLSKALFTSEKDYWETPQDFFDELNNEFHFTLDPASTSKNTKCEKYYTQEEDGLLRSWQGEIVFCNPPYGRQVGKWVKKCFEESRHAKVVMLIPARTDTAYFHDYILGKAEIRFIRGRLSFEIDGEKKGRAPFPCMVVIY